MFSITGYNILSEVHKGESSQVYRAIRICDNRAVILKVLNDSFHNLLEKNRYKQVYRISRTIGTDGIVQVFGLEEHQAQLVMILEDFGGESLKKWINRQRSFTMDELLTYTIRITEILGHIHTQNIIHKDINPSHIILDPASGVLKIIGFGISSQLSKQHLTLKNPAVLEGTLEYISPEQTGRMNRGLDYRTDFYSLGATFYELFTGVLPFSTTDAMELVHCHVAKQPKPPVRINPDMPITISNIILKLLEKTAETRYQSVGGLKKDLEECIKQWQATGQIEPFSLARFDLSEKFTISQKLYGREDEIKILQDAFERVSFKGDDARSQGLPEMMLVTGYSGIGKSMLVKEIYKSLAEKQGHFISGKFDQLQRNIPYSAIINAFRELVQQLLTESEVQIAQWRERVLIALEGNGQIIIDILPEVKFIIGPQPEVSKVGPAESQNRFNLVFKNFMRVFCRPEHPLAIFLDDLQWIDSASLKWLELLMTDRGNNTSLFFIGAYRDNEVDSTHPLVATLDKLREEGVTIKQIPLGPLAFKHCNHLIADSLHQNLEATGPLTALIMDKTGGNPFFVNQFFHTLYQDDLLHYVPLEAGQKSHWRWSLELIEKHNITDNVVDLMIGKLKKMSSSTQQVLRLASCVGNRFDLDTLSDIYGETKADTFQDLLPALTEGLVLPLSEPEIPNGTIQSLQFLHDRVQQAAYSLIEDDHKKETHLQIGRLLVRKITEDILQERIFQTTDHFNMAIELLKDDNEKIDIARLNLTAGNRAISAMAGEAAREYFQTGYSLLSEKGWEKHYSLAFNLTCGLIEACHLTAFYQKAQKLCESALPHARSTLDKARIYSLQCYNFTLTNKMEKTLTTGLEALKIFNIPILEKSPEIVDIDQLLDLPEMTDPEKLAAMSILVSIISCALVTQSPLMMPLIHTMVNLSIRHGNCSKAPFGYVWYGCSLCWSRTDIGLGYQFGRLAIDVMKKFNPCEVETTVLHQFNSFIRHWCEHERTSINEFPNIVQVSKKSGDIEYGTYVAVNYVTNLLLVGEPLKSVKEKQRPYLDWVAGTRFSFSLAYGSIWAQATQCLMNKGNSTSLLQGDFMDENILIQEMQETKNNLNLFSVYAAKAMLSCINGRFHESAAFAMETEKYEEAIGGLLPVTQPPFYGALALLKITPRDAGGKTNDNKTLESYTEKLRLWSKLGHKNFQHKYNLVEAEKARVFGKKWDAAELYEKAISGAKENGYLHEEALSYELAAAFYLERGMDKIAQTYMAEAYYCYQQWGALGKVEGIEERYPHFFPFTARATSTEATVPATRMISSGSQWLDLNSIMKATQVLYTEKVLSRLLDKMMHIVIENAGAEKGILLLPKQDNWFIEAEGYIDNSDSIVLQSLPIEESEQVAANIIHYVARTQKNLVLHNAAREGIFTDDAYIVKHRPKSVLCVPLVNQSQLTGILYLENNLTTGAFTSERLELLALFSSQIAISIENSLLYHNLEEKVTERTYELEQEIIDRKQAEKKLQNSEELFRLVTQTAEIGITNTDLISGRIVWDETCYKIHGYKPGSLIKLDYYLDKILHPDEKTRKLPEYRSAIDSNDNRYRVEYRIIRPDGSVRWLYEDHAIIRNENGNAIRTYSAKMDITERKQLEEQLRQSQKMESIGTLAGGIAHDFNNILGIIVGNTEMAMDDVPEWNPARFSLEEVRKASLRARDMVKQILSFSRQTKQVEKPIRISPIIEDSLKLIRSSLPTTIEIRQNLSGPEDTILADPTQMNQILINLCTNANHAMGEKGGILEVNLNNIDISEKDIPCYHDLSPGKYLVLTVSDTGHGIAPDVVERIFEPYFTTKEIDEGTGMGLAVVHGIVKNHNGDIYAYSEPGKGTTFKVLFPLHRSETELNLTAPKQISTGTERILFVDDEEALADLGKRMLQRLGYEVTVMTSSIEALETFKAEPDKYDLLLTDMTMPNMTGKDLSLELLRIRPGFPIIVCTGFSEIITEESTDQMGIRGFVMKPLVMHEIAKTIRQVLD